MNQPVQWKVGKVLFPLLHCCCWKATGCHNLGRSSRGSPFPLFPGICFGRDDGWCEVDVGYAFSKDYSKKWDVSKR